MLETLGIEDGIVAITGGTGTFDLFAPLLDAFVLSEVHGLVLPGRDTVRFRRAIRGWCWRRRDCGPAMRNRWATASPSPGGRASYWPVVR